MKTIISFDFDGTLGHVPYIQNICKCLLIDPHNEVHIVTRRYGKLHPVEGDEVTPVLGVAKKLGIKLENVHFTNRQYKVNKLIEIGADIHYDDDFTEIKLIRELFPKCKAFQVFI